MSINVNSSTPSQNTQKTPKGVAGRLLTTQPVVATSPFEGLNGVEPTPLPGVYLLRTNTANTVLIPSNTPPYQTTVNGVMQTTPIGVALEEELRRTVGQGTYNFLAHRLTTSERDITLAELTVSRILENGNATPSSLPRPSRMAILPPSTNAGEISTNMPGPATSCVAVLYGQTNANSAFLGARQQPVATVYFNVELLPINHTPMYGQVQKLYTAVATATMVTTVTPGNTATIEALLYTAANASQVLRAIAIQQELSLPTDEITWNKAGNKDSIARRNLLEMVVDIDVAFELSPQTVDTVTITGKETIAATSGNIPVWSDTNTYSAFNGEYVSSNTTGMASMITPTTMVRKLSGQEDAMVEFMAAYMTPGPGGNAAMLKTLNNIIMPRLDNINVVAISPRYQISRVAKNAWIGGVQAIGVEVNSALGVNIAPQQAYYSVG